MNQIFTILLVIFGCNLGKIVFGFSGDDLIVETKLGLIRGVKADDGPYTKFMGIPYAKVNESNVFGEALPYPPFDGIFEANNDGAICPQREEFNFTVTGSLDCLDLNIYVPDSASPQNPLPVMLWIYQGRFMIGFAGLYTFGPQYLIRHDVILVTFNYRLGVYGFMCLDTPEVPGNSGLKDQIKAMKWVKENIAAFGGDPDKITLFGNSAGSMAIGLHLVSDEDKLYDKVIMQSGQAIYSGTLIESDPTLALRLAESLGFLTNDNTEALSYLSTVDEHTLVQTAINQGLELRPCIEKKFPNVKQFISDRPVGFKVDKVKDMAIIVGYTDLELLGLFLNNSDTYYDSRFTDALNATFDLEENVLTELGSIVRRFYIGDAEMSEDLMYEMNDFASDYAFIYPTLRSAKIFLENEAEKVYLYVFSYNGTRNYVKVRTDIPGENIRPGGLHADELGYLFTMEFSKMPDPTPEDQAVIDRMTAMWANFAKYGDPTPNTSQLLPYKWHPITKGSQQHYMKIDKELEVGTSHYHQRMNFWELLFTAYGEYERGYRGDDVPDSSFTARLSPVLVLFVLFVASLGPHLVNSSP